MSKSNPRVSVVIPVHNAQQYLRECLDSILNQTMRELEVICVDDASTDDSPSILKEYAAADGRVKYLRHDENVSASQCRKDGVLGSTGDYVMFVDADDYIEPNACQAAVQAIEEKGVDILQFGTVVENCANLPQKRIQSNQNMLQPYTERVLTGSLLQACFEERKMSVGVWNKIFRGELCRKAFALVEDGFFPKANDLYALFLLLHQAKSFAGVDIPLYHYCFGRGMTGQSIMSGEKFRLHCQSARVYGALKRYCDGLTGQDREVCQAAVQRVRGNFHNEVCGRWLNNLEEDSKLEGLEIIGEVWGMDRTQVLAALANAAYSQRNKVAPYLKQAPFLKYTPGKIKTIALYYRNIVNGGAQRVVAQLCNLFAAVEEGGQAKYRVVLLTDEEPTDEDYATLPQVERVVLPHRERFPKEDYALRAQAWKEFLDTHQVDVVLYSMWVDVALFWDMLCIKSHPSHPAFVVHAHSFCSMMYRLGGSIVDETFTSFAMADGVVTLSQCDRKYWQYVNPRTLCIPNPCHVAPAASHRAKYGKDILWLGRISQEKQPLEMVRIMEHVVKQIPDAVCHMVGSGDEELMAQLEQAVQDAGLENNVVLEGFQSEVERYYAANAVFVMTSSFEGAPLTLLESAAYGLPTVTYDLPWLEYYAQMKGWAKVPQRDARGAAQEIVQLLKDEAHWKKQSDGLYSSFESYQNQDLLAQWQRLFALLEGDTCPQTEALDPDFGVLLRQIGRFHEEGLEKIREEKREINDKLQITYQEKFDRGVEIKRLRGELERAHHPGLKGIVKLSLIWVKDKLGRGKREE